MSVWSLGRRIGFRFSTLVALLLLAPFPAPLVPGTGWLARAFDRLWEIAVAWFAELVLGIDAPPHVFTGSGDTRWHFVQLALIGVLAAVGTLAWSIVDRRRQHYERLQSIVLVALRYFLATMMLWYGIAKVAPVQFPPLWLGRYDVPVGEMSPMGLLWTFMSHSQPYVIATGAMEMVAGLLLVVRRTQVFGALLAAVVMTNVVLLNLCYDVPVKLFSMELLAMAVAIALPHARRLVGAALGYPTPGAPLRVRGSARHELARSVVKLTLLASIAVNAWGLLDFAFGRERAPSPLHGTWHVERHVRDGVEVPPLFTDPTRWRKLILHERGATLRFATDHRTSFRTRIDTTERTLTLVRPLGRTATFRYARPAETRLVLDGDFAGHRLHLELALEPPPPLTTRGFHWIQDEPFHR